MRINEIESQMMAAYVDWASFIGNFRGIRKGSIITWTDRIPHMLDHPVMASKVTALADDGQYTFQVFQDGSIIQLYYSYDRRGNELQSARLAYYSAVTDDKLARANKSSTDVMASVNDVIDSSFQDEIEDERISSEPTEEDEVAFTVTEGPVSWLRIEYDPQASKGVLHHDCHMHLSAFPYSRFVVAGIPSPRQFIEFIMAFCYPQQYQEHRLNDQGQYTSVSKITSVNSLYFSTEDSAVFNQIAHFRIPFSVTP